MDVLIIDDDPDVLSAYTRLLEREGYSVTVASNGLEASLEIKLRPYHVIVCDVLMPFQEGTDFHRWLKQEFPALARKVVFVTGMADDAGVHTLLEETGRPCLRKPVDPAVLVREVGRVAKLASE